MKKLMTLFLMLVLILSVRAQAIEGDALLDIVGSSASTDKFISTYKLVKTGTDLPFGTEYSTDRTDGIQAEIRNDTVMMITLVSFNLGSGSYKNKLPKGITFGSSVAEVKKKLGKATYPHPQVGYYEYVIGKIVLACHFNEIGALDMVILTPQWVRGPD